MLYHRLYLVRPSEALVARCGDDEDSDLLVEFIIESPEGGRTAWASEDYERRAKILALLHLKSLTSDAIFDEPVSTSFFDRWWTIRSVEGPVTMQDVLDSTDPDTIIEPTGRALVDTWIDDRHNWTEFPYYRTYEPERYRIFFEDDVIGWLKDPVWDPPNLTGTWSPTTNAGGKQFSKAFAQETDYQITVEGPTFVDGALRISDGRATVHVKQPTKD